jgi:hypothetical protein
MLQIDGCLIKLPLPLPPLQTKKAPNNTSGGKILSSIFHYTILIVNELAVNGKKVPL